MNEWSQKIQKPLLPDILKTPRKDDQAADPFKLFTRANI